MENPENSLEQLRFITEEIKSFYFLPEQDKADILFVSQGLKSAALIELGYQPDTASYPRAEFEGNIRELEQALLSLNIPFERKTDNDAEDNMEYEIFYLGKDEQAKDNLLAATSIENQKERDQAFGEALDIPQTAIDAFVRGERFNLADLPEEVRHSKELQLANFIPSREHWKEELEIVKERQKRLEALLPGYFHS